MDNEEMVMRLFQERHREGYTIVMVTHDPEVAQIADRIIHFEHGKIVSERQNHADLCSNPS